jgi:transposase
MNGVEPYAYLHDLFIKLANSHLAKDIGALTPWAYAPTAITSQARSSDWDPAYGLHQGQRL